MNNGKLHEVDVVFNVSKLKFYLSTLITVAIILSAIFGFMLRVNEMANDIEILKVQMNQFTVWAKTHEDANQLFRENVIRKLDRSEFNQQKIYEKLGFKWYSHVPDDEE